MPVQTNPKPGLPSDTPLWPCRTRYRRRIAHPGLPVAFAQVARLHAAERIGVIVIESAGRRIGLAGDAELLQAGQEFFQMLAAEMAEDVLPRGVLAAPHDQPQDQGGHQRVVEGSDRAIRGRVSPRISHRGRRR